jgi:hypothetical protein
MYQEIWKAIDNQLNNLGGMNESTNYINNKIYSNYWITQV